MSEPGSTPWGGDLSEHIADLLQKSQGESGGKDDQLDPGDTLFCQTRS